MAAAAGRPRKVVPKTQLKITFESQGFLSIWGDLRKGPITVPGSFDQFEEAFRVWLREYQAGPKRIRKPAKPKEKLEAGEVLAKLENLKT